MRTLNELMIRHGMVCREAAAIMRERHQRYGYENILESGPMGIPVRMADKLARIRTISANPKLEEGDTDTLRDTFLDMMNYATIGIMLMDGTWGRLAEEEENPMYTMTVDNGEEVVIGEVSTTRNMARDYGQIRELLGDLQKDMHHWSNHNFGDQPALHPIMGLFEEMGEFAHAWLKNEQGIRVNEDHEANMKDALGDWMVFANDVCSRMGWSFGDILIDTWEQVRKRDWKKNKEDGINA